MRIYTLIALLVSMTNVLPLLSPIVDCIHQSPADDDVVVSESRLQSVRQALPALAVIGYITDGETTKGNLMRLDSCRRFYMTQYALAPNIVVHDIKRRFIIGDFSSPQAARTQAQLHGLRIIRDFGHGIMLLRAPEAP